MRDDGAEGYETTGCSASSRHVRVVIKPVKHAHRLVDGCVPGRKYWKRERREIESAALVQQAWRGCRSAGGCEPVWFNQAPIEINVGLGGFVP